MRVVMLHVHSCDITSLMLLAIMLLQVRLAVGIRFCAFTCHCDCRSLSRFCLRLPSLTTRQVHSLCSLGRQMFAGSCRYAALWSLARVVLIRHGRTLPTSEFCMHSCSMLRSRLYRGGNFRVCQMIACGHIFLVYTKYAIACQIKPAKQWCGGCSGKRLGGRGCHCWP